MDDKYKLYGKLDDVLPITDKKPMSFQELVELRTGQSSLYQKAREAAREYESAETPREKYKAESRLCRIADRFGETITIHEGNKRYIPKCERFEGYRIPKLIVVEVPEEESFFPSMPLLYGVIARLKDEGISLPDNWLSTSTPHPILDDDLVIKNIECLDAEGKVFEAYDEIRIPKGDKGDDPFFWNHPVWRAMTGDRALFEEYYDVVFDKPPAYTSEVVDRLLGVREKSPREKK